MNAGALSATLAAKKKAARSSVLETDVIFRHRQGR